MTENYLEDHKIFEEEYMRYEAIVDNFIEETVSIYFFFNFISIDIWAKQTMNPWTKLRRNKRKNKWIDKTNGERSFNNIVSFESAWSYCLD